MRRAAAVVAVSAALAAWAACGPIAPAPAPDAPLNRCPDHPCDAYKQEGATPACNGETCLVGAAFANTLLVSPSQTANYAPGEALILTPQYLTALFASQKVPSYCDTFPPDSGAIPAVCTCLPKDCLLMPAIGRSQGALKVSGTLAATQWPPAGLRPADADPYTSLPARVTFRPMATPDGQSFVEARSLGLPLSDLDARDATFALLSPGPNNGPPTGWDVPLQSGPDQYGIGVYVRRVEPLAPFESAFPPVVGPIRVLGGQSFAAITMDALDPTPSLRSFKFMSQGTDLTGWRAELVLQDTRERVSTVATLGAATGGEVVLQTAIGLGTGTPVTNLANQALVLLPPEGRALPTYTIENIGGAIFTDHTIPALPAPVVVSGQVQLAGQGHAARVVFESQKEGGIEIAGGAYDTLLSYRTSVTTDAGGAYSVVLPPGKYTAWVMPDRRDAAVTPVAFLVGSGVSPQNGRSLGLRAPTALRGRIRVTDGRDLGGADLVLVPAALQVDGTSAWSLPRPVTTRTARDGSFEVAVDPGTYDLAIRPAAGTRLPWVVSTTRTVGQGSVELDPLYVPAPIRVTLVLRDPAGNALVGALVRAFAPSALPPQNDPRRPVYEVGRAFTDQNGRFEMFLAGPPK